MDWVILTTGNLVTLYGAVVLVKDIWKLNAELK